MVRTTTHRKFDQMPKKTRKIEAKRDSLFLPFQSMNSRPPCHLRGLGHPASHWVVSKGYLVPCPETMA